MSLLTMQASQRGMEIIKQARNARKWTIDDPRWLIQVSKFLGRCIK